tara:strand:+ start:18599 stop:20122 length:1524 start_codon:yes stop_codon:yes gene_type:complete
MQHLTKHLSKDIPASIVVFLVALPLCLGIALASGTSLFSGLISGIIGGIVVGALSGSSISVSGPAAGLTAIVLSAVEGLGDYRIFLLAVVLAGIIQLVLGILKAGVIGYYFPSSVIKGMLAAIGLILIFKQIPHAIGFDKDYEGDMSFFQLDHENTLSEIGKAIEAMTPGAIIISSISLLLLILMEVPKIKKFKLFQILPPALFVVLIGTLINVFFQSSMASFALEQEHLVSIPIAGSIHEFIGQFTTPDFTAFSNPEIYTIAITIALVASLESLLCIEAADKLDPHKRITPASKELRAQGIGNIVSGLIGGIPITAVIVRSSANIEAGAQTKLSAILHGIFLLGTAALIPQVLNLIPLSCLAAILLMVGYKLVKPSIVVSMYRKGWSQFIPFVITVVAVFFTDLLIGIGVGLVVGVFFVIRSNYPKAIKITQHNNHYLIRFRKDVSFINKALIADTFSKIEENGYVVLDAKHADFIDNDIKELIYDFIDNAKYQNIKVTLEGFENK